MGRAIGGLCLVQPLAGCFLGTEHPDLALAIPATYRDASTRPRAALPKPDWWRGFHSRELTKLIEDAQSNNLDIAAAVARIVQADAQARISGAALLPAIDFGASVNRTRASRAPGSGLVGTSGGIEGSGGQSVRNSFAATFTASYELDFWGKNRALVRAAEETAIASRFDREVVALSTMAAVANAYFQVLSAQDRLRYARENVDSANRILGIIKERLAVGTASELDVAQQQSLVDTQRAVIPTLEQIVRQNTAALAVLVGRAPEFVRIHGGSSFKVTVPRVEPGLPSELLTRRPDIREAEANLAAANANVESARAAFFPSINLSAQGGWQATALKFLTRPEAAAWEIAANLTQPVFDGGLLQGQLDQQKGRQDELLQDYRKAIVQAFADVDSALVALQQNSIRERLENAVVTSSQLAFRLSEQRLREGTIDLTTVLTAQQALFQAQDLLAQVRLARLLAVVSLFQALGGGWVAEPATHRVVHR
jgi:NodT family efflux transporter outer membrane factor (OMF) lipoprotein